MNLSAAEGTELRADFAAFAFDDLCTFYRKAEPTEEDRGQESSEPDVEVLADVPCRVGTSQAQASENETAGQVQSKLRVKLFFPYGTAKPAEADYVLVTTQNDRRIDVTASVWVTGMLSEELDGLAIPMPQSAESEGTEMLMEDGDTITEENDDVILEEAA